MPAHCLQQFDTGPCRASVRKYYYSAKSGQCEIFTYGGCRGNKNNFKNKEECMKSCSDKKTTSGVTNASKYELWILYHMYITDS